MSGLQATQAGRGGGRAGVQATQRCPRCLPRALTVPGMQTCGPSTPSRQVLCGILICRQAQRCAAWLANPTHPVPHLCGQYVGAGGLPLLYHKLHCRHGQEEGDHDACTGYGAAWRSRVSRVSTAQPAWAFRPPAAACDRDGILLELRLPTRHPPGGTRGRINDSRCTA